jgi:hypothetical protein
MFSAMMDCSNIRNKTEEQVGVSNVLKLAEGEETDVKWGGGQGERI